MINSIKADMYRLFRSKTVWLVISLFLALQLRAVFTLKPFEPIFDTHFVEASSPFSDLKLISYNYGVLIESIFTVGTLVCSMYSEGLLKNSIICGKSIKKIPIYKTVTAVYINISILFIQNLTIYILNLLLHKGYRSTFFPNVLLVTLWQAVPVIGWTCFLIFIAAVVRKYSYFLAAIFVPLIALSSGIRTGYYLPTVIMGYIVYEPYVGFRIYVALFALALSLISVFLFWLHTNRRTE